MNLLHKVCNYVLNHMFCICNYKVNIQNRLHKIHQGMYIIRYLVHQNMISNSLYNCTICNMLQNFPNLFLFPNHNQHKTFGNFHIQNQLNFLLIFQLIYQGSNNFLIKTQHLLSCLIFLNCNLLLRN